MAADGAAFPTFEVTIQGPAGEIECTAMQMKNMIYLWVGEKGSKAMGSVSMSGIPREGSSLKEIPKTNLIGDGVEDLTVTLAGNLSRRTSISFMVAGVVPGNDDMMLALVEKKILLALQERGWIS